VLSDMRHHMPHLLRCAVRSRYGLTTMRTLPAAGVAGACAGGTVHKSRQGWTAAPASLSDLLQLLFHHCTRTTTQIRCSMPPQLRVCQATVCTAQVRNRHRQQGSHVSWQSPFTHPVWGRTGCCRACAPWSSTCSVDMQRHTLTKGDLCLPRPGMRLTGLTAVALLELQD
jgi:hypothetical protein